jgi:hypothetical protein
VDSIEIRHEEREIDGVRVANDGSVLDSTAFIFGTNYATEPDVTGTSSGWLVAWQRAPSHDSPYNTARLASLTPAACRRTKKTSGRWVHGGPGRRVRRVGRHQRPRDVERRRRRRRSVRGLVGTPTGSSSGIAINAQANDQFETNVAWNGSVYQVTWTDWRIHPLIEPGEGDVYTTAVTTRAGRQPARHRVAADPDVPEGNAAVAGAKGTTVFGWTKLHDESPYAAFRVETASQTGCVGTGSALAHSRPRGPRPRSPSRPPRSASPIDGRRLRREVENRVARDQLLRFREGSVDDPALCRRRSGSGRPCSCSRAQRPLRARRRRSSPGPARATFATTPRTAVVGLAARPSVHGEEPERGLVGLGRPRSHGSTTGEEELASPIAAGELVAPRDRFSFERTRMSETAHELDARRGTDPGHGALPVFVADVDSFARRLEPSPERSCRRSAAA